MPSNVLSLSAGDRCGELRKAACERTTRWRHRSATGALWRSCVLPELSAAAGTAGRHVQVKVELLDPANEVACRHYRDWAGFNSVLDAQRLLEIEIFATILAVCQERKANKKLHAHIRFSPSFPAHQIDLTDNRLVLTGPGHAEQAVTAFQREQLYRSYEREFDVGWDQARPTELKLRAVEWSPLRDGESIPGYRILNLCRELDLPTPAFTDDDLRAIVERLESHEKYSDDPSGGVDSA